jgi:hypothetical protein
MWATKLYLRSCNSHKMTGGSLGLINTTQRNFCYRWNNKFRHIFYPKSWNTPEKRESSNLRMGKVKWRTQDPLYLDERSRHIHGGIDSFLTRIHDEKVYNVPLRNIAFVLYNEAKEKRGDRHIYKMFEQNYHNLQSTKICPRECFGGLWACYESGYASPEGISFWEKHMEEQGKGMHSTWIVELLQAFNKNKPFEASYMIEKFDKIYKPRLLQIWDEQVLFNQRTMISLIKELTEINYYDEEIYSKILDSIIQKNKVQNLYFFDIFYNFFHNVNENPKFTLYQKLGDKITAYEDKHYTEDMRLRYDIEERRLRTHLEMVANRDTKKWEDLTIIRFVDARSDREKLRIEEEQRRKNAVYNEDLFIEYIQKLMAEGKSNIEMMVYLDVDEAALQNAFTIISQREQHKKLEELRKNEQLPG